MARPFDSIVGKEITFNTTHLYQYILKMDATLKVVLENQAQILAKLNDTNANELLDKFDLEVEQYMVDSFNAMAEGKTPMTRKK